MNNDLIQTALTAPHPYVIINDTDAPEPHMVCQWVPGKGYCYLDRCGTKRRHDGMQAAEATPVEAFGWRWVHDTDGWVRFYLSDQPVTATYSDGKPRRWQHPAEGFEYPRLVKLAGKMKAPA